MYAELNIDQGSTFESRINLSNDDETPISVANNTFISQIRKSYYSSSPTANLVITVNDAPNGAFTISLDAANTANIKAGRYLYDVKMTSNANVSLRIVEGIITINPQVSR